MNQKKINSLLIVTNADLAGAPIHVRDLAIGLHKKGNNVSVVFGEAGVIKDALDQAGIKTFIISTMRSNINIQQDFSSVRELIRIVNIVCPDVLHAHSSKAGLIARIVGFYLSLPVIYTVHGWGFGRGRRIIISVFVYLTELILSLITKKFISVSNADREIGMKYLALPNSKISTIYNGSEFNAMSRGKELAGLHLIMVARNDPQKDYDTFFKALALSNFDAALVVGRGTDEDSFIANARSLSGNNFKKIQFLGSRSDVEALLEKSTLFVLSSRFEGLPISIIEAMSKGLPVLASAVGGVPELVSHGVNGYLFIQGKYEDLASCINDFWDNPSKVKSYGDASYARFKHDFGASSMVDDVSNVYTSIVMKGKL